MKLSWFSSIKDNISGIFVFGSITFFLTGLKQVAKISRIFSLLKKQILATNRQGI